MSKNCRLSVRAFHLFIFIILCFIQVSHASPFFCAPGWHGQVLFTGDSLANWSIETDAGATGAVVLTTGLIDQAVQLNWNLGSGAWVQAKYTFARPVDLSQFDIFGLCLHGSPGIKNRISLMFADIHGVFFGLDCDGINILSRWLINLPFPKKLFYWFFTIGTDANQRQIDWQHISRFFVVVKRPEPGKGGGLGQLAIDQLQADRAADWPRQVDFESVAGPSDAADKAIGYLLQQQKATGLFQSWQEELQPKAHLYDQALILIALTREGHWQRGTPLNEAAQKSQKLFDFIVKAQKVAGYWPRTWNPTTGQELTHDPWVGDQAWMVMALVQYGQKSLDPIADVAAFKCADWLARQIDVNGKVVASTEGNVDVWWAMAATKHFSDADKIQTYLLTRVWDSDLQYWWRGYGDYPDPFVAMDAATWLSAFTRTARVNRPELGLAALSFVRRALVTTDNSGQYCGFDGMGTVSIWCEGTAQYVCAGGMDAQQFLDMLLSLQRTTGGMPGSTDDWSSDCFGWLSSWTGLAPTAWLYFALTGSPFPVIKDATPINAEFNMTYQISLIPAYPNPFNSFTRIEFILPRPERVTLGVFDITGREVVRLLNGEVLSGVQVVKLNTANLPSGIYFCQIEAESRRITQKIICTR